MFLDVIKGLFVAFWSFLKYPIYLILILFLIFSMCCGFWFVFRFIQGKRLLYNRNMMFKKEGFFYRLFYKLPRQFVDDILNTEPDFFNPQGCIIFEGRQGAGKTIAMTHYINQLQKTYPKAKITTNYAYKNEDTELTDWRMLLNYKNDKKGVIVGLDELQNWFSSMDSKNFPPEMLTVITQNRKNRRLILGTAQNFYLLAKAIRSQATEVRRCSTLLRCLTIVRRFEPILDSEGNVVEFKRRGSYFFVHDPELRESYDTYKVIERLSKVGFKDIVPQTDIINNMYVVNSKKGLK